MLNKDLNNMRFIHTQFHVYNPSSKTQKLNNRNITIYKISTLKNFTNEILQQSNSSIYYFLLFNLWIQSEMDSPDKTLPNVIIYKIIECISCHTSFIFFWRILRERYGRGNGSVVKVTAQSPYSFYLLVILQHQKLIKREM